MIPPKEDYRWKALVTGQRAHKSKVFALNMLIARLIQKTKLDPSEASIEQSVDEAATFFKKFEKILPEDIQTLFGEGT